VAYFAKNQKMIYDRVQLKSLVELYRLQGKTIVFTNGCFDILNSGHVSFLRKARELGDILILAVNDDESIARIKGESRPINTLEQRIDVLSGLSSIDHIFTFGELDDSPLEFIHIIKPQIYVKGGNYDKSDLEESPLVVQNGGDIVIIPLIPNVSTANTIGKIMKINEID
jgi:D-beta-D-heptose 7-phosphate kinase/D-beta-D-heptose 1-phosphate adenosyltransferase